jgi:hypothetical protein
LQHPPFHPKWTEVNLGATVPGWTRFSVAQDMLNKISQHEMTAQQADFNDFLSRQPRAPTSEADRDALFREFLQWRGNRQIR